MRLVLIDPIILLGTSLSLPQPQLYFSEPQSSLLPNTESIFQIITFLQNPSLNICYKRHSLMIPDRCLGYQTSSAVSKKLNTPSIP